MRTALNNSSLVFFLLISLLACKPKETEQAISPVSIDSRPVDGDYAIAITNPGSDIGFIRRYPKLKLDVIVSGNRDTDGFLTNVNTTVIYNPNSKDWIATGYEKGYPTRITTSNGYSMDLKNYNKNDLTVDMIVSLNGKVIRTLEKQKLEDFFFNGIENNPMKGARITNSCENIRKAIQGVGVALGATAVLVAIAFPPAGILEGILLANTAIGVANGFSSLVSGETLTSKIFNEKTAEFVDAGLYRLSFLDLFPKPDKTLDLINKILSIPTKVTDVPGKSPCEDQDKEQGKANSWGDPHINTFDGLSYDFQAWGEFIAVKSKVDNFEVQVRQIGTENGQISYNQGLAIQTGSDVVCYLNNNLYINNKPQSYNFTDLSLKDNASLKLTNDLLKITSKYGDVISIPRGRYDYKIELSESRKNKVGGLFGNFDGIKENELSLKNGTIITLKSTQAFGLSVELPFNEMYPTYADSWRVEQKNSLFYYENGKNTETFTRKDYPKELVVISQEKKLLAEGVCKAAGVNKEPFLSGCIFDVAHTNNSGLALESLWGQENSNTKNILQLNVIPEPIDLKKITITSKGSFLLKNDGTLWLSASKNHSMFGIGNNPINKPGYFVKIMDNIKDIASGSPDNHMLYLKNDNSLWASGENFSGKLGIGGSGLGVTNNPVKIMSDVKSMQIGYDVSFVLKIDNTLWAFGQISGMFGDKTKANSNLPIKVLENVKSIFSNGINTLFIKTDNSLWGTARDQYLTNNSGQFGSTFSKTPPFKIAENVIFAAPQQYSNFYIKSDFSLWLSGSNIFFKFEKKDNFVKIMSDVQSISSTSSNSSLILKTDNTLWAIGNNNSFGVGTNNDESVPIKILDNVKSVYTYNGSTFVHKLDNTLWASGNNSFFSNNMGLGVLGIGIIDKNIYNFVPIRLN
ncbi:MAG TPA: VWD domain-containing protein [Leadbetterella sp.]|nr:VWD domain-containing protein [Leadbetterella sp.]